MDVFEIYADNRFCGFTETLQDAKTAASPLIGNFDIRIEHPCAAATTAVWRHDPRVSDWVQAG